MILIQMALEMSQILGWEHDLLDIIECVPLDDFQDGYLIKFRTYKDMPWHSVKVVLRSLGNMGSQSCILEGVAEGFESEGYLAGKAEFTIDWARDKKPEIILYMGTPAIA